MFVSLISTGPGLFSSRISSGSTGSAIKLNLSARPPILPADGGTYDALVLQFVNTTSGVPFIPQSNLTIYLSSSNDQTGSVAQSVVYPAGATFEVVNFTTTSLPGTAVITALCQGYPAATQTVMTELVGGIPIALKVYTNPSQLPPNAALHGNVIVQVVDSFGNPIKLASNVTIALSSSDTQIGTVPSSVVIAAQSTFASVPFTPTYLAGTTTITASAPGLSAGSAIMTTTGPVPRRLVLSVAPSIIIAKAGESATLTIQLQDNNSQTPAPAPAPVSVVVTSDDTAVANVTQTINTIAAGSSYVSVTLKSGGGQGVATVTASAQGYLKGSVSVQAVAQGTAPKKLGIYFAPSTLLPNSNTYAGAAVVELLDNNVATCPVSSTDPFGGCPTVNGTSAVWVYARSSDNASMQVSTGVAQIPSGSSHVSLNLSTTYVPGQADITAQSPGLSSATAGLLSFGNVANGLLLSVAPGLLLSDGGTYSVVSVSLINTLTNEPAIAPVSIQVSLRTDTTSLGQIQNLVTIPAGQDYALASFSTLGIPGTALITASASNYTATNTTLALTVPAGARIGVFAMPNALLASGASDQNIVVQLQDQFGNPVKTDVPITVELASQNLTVGSVTPQVTISAGSASADASVQTTKVGGILNITALANGFQSGAAGIKTTLLPMNAQLTSTISAVLLRRTTSLSLVASSEGTGLSGASVSWEATSGSFINVENLTSSNGYANATYQAGVVPGQYLLRVTVSKPGYERVTAQIPITVESVGGVVTTGTTSSGLLNQYVGFVPFWALMPVIVAAPIGSFFFIRRRRGMDDGGSDADDGDDDGMSDMSGGAGDDE